MNKTIDDITRHAAWLADAWEPLHESRIKGTPRRWRQTDITPARRAQLDATHRAEKQAHGAPAGADSPAPIHIDVLDLTLDITGTAYRIAKTIATHTEDPTTLVYLSRQTNHEAPDLLTYIARRANHLDTTDTLIEKVATTIERQLRHLRNGVANQFTEVVDGQRLKANCPWCEQPALYFRAIGPEHNTEIVIRCESKQCEPAPEYCGTHHQGNPTWPFHEWSWLAKHINHTNPTPVPA